MGSILGRVRELPIRGSISCGRDRDHAHASIVETGAKSPILAIRYPCRLFLSPSLSLSLSLPVSLLMDFSTGRPLH